tara:strand:- start:774 stop:1244 length:471 start_codon:yes stop_codon:yes gene_type:complete
MNRRLETEETKIAEREIMDALCLRWAARARKMHFKYVLDFMVFKGGRSIAWVEAKDRPNWGGHDSYMLGLHKWMTASQYMLFTGLPTIIAVRLAGRLLTYKIAPPQAKHFEVIEGGRRDRSEPSDIEPCILIPLREFEPWNESSSIWSGPAGRNAE